MILALVVIAAPLCAQNTGLLSPRENYERVLVLFGQGHVFTADELQSLETLRGKLADAGDTDLAAEVAVLRLAALTHTDHDTAASEAEASLATDVAANDLAAAKLRDASAWRLTRDIGLYSFTFATAATLLLAVTANQEEAWLHNGTFSDGQSKQNFNRAVEWGVMGSAGVMLLSLFPLLIGQANQ